MITAPSPLNFPTINQARRFSRVNSVTVLVTIALKPGVYVVRPDGTLDWREK